MIPIHDAHVDSSTREKLLGRRFTLGDGQVWTVQSIGGGKLSDTVVLVWRDQRTETRLVSLLLAIEAGFIHEV